MSNKIPTISKKELGIDKASIKLIEKEGIDGNIIDSELEIIIKIVSTLKPKRIFEIGTFDGRTTINLANNTPEDTVIFSLDLPKEKINSTKYKLYSNLFTDRDDKRYIEKSEIGEQYKDKQNSYKIKQLLGDSATFDFSSYIKFIDFIFVDGSHAKDYVKNDTEIALQLASKNSIIMWHDYTNWEDVTNVMNDYYEKDDRFKNIKQIENTTFLYLEK